MRVLTLVLLAGLLLVGGSVRAAPPAGPAHGLSMHGDLKYGPEFTHFEYANPDAPKGGEIRLSAIGTFDNFNPFILRGVPAAGIGNIFDTLMVQSDDEPFSEYGLVAETVETPPDRSWVIFNLRAEARFHDGSPMTAERYAAIRDDELGRLQSSAPDHRWADASALLDDLVLSDDFVEFLTLPAYPLLG